MSYAPVRGLPDDLMLSLEVLLSPLSAFLGPGADEAGCVTARGMETVLLHGPLEEGHSADGTGAFLQPCLLSHGPAL